MKREADPLTPCPRFAVLALWAAFSVTAAAQSDIAHLPLEQLVQMEITTASRYAQTSLEAPAVVSVVTAEDIRAFGYRNLADVLNSMRGLYVSYDRAYHFLGNRGFATPGDYNTRVLLLVNGVRFNDNLYDQATIGTEFPIDMDLVERVEFVPGPGSAVYGANAFFGVINVITRTGRKLNGPQVSVEAGSHGSTKARFSLGTVDALGTDWLIAATRSATRGEDQYFSTFDAPDTHHGVAQRLDFDRSTQLFARMQHEGLTLTLAHGERTKGIPTASFSQVFNDPRSRFIDTTTRAAAEYTAQLRPSLTFTGRLHAGQYRYVGDYMYDYPPLTLNRDVGTGRWWGTEWQWVSTAVSQHKLSWGVDYRRDTSIRQTNDDVAPVAAQYLNASSQGDAVAFYVQDEFALTPALTLHTGLRWGKQTGSAGSVNPRLGLVYWWNPSTALKLLHGTAYRPPNAYERDYRVDLPGGIVEAHRLRSEKVRTTELAVEHAPTGATRMLLTVFRSQVTGLISLADAGDSERFTVNNARGVSVLGVEAEIEQRLRGDARIRAAYGWQKARDRVADATLTNAPAHLLKVQWSDSLRTPAGWGWASARYGIEAVGIGPRRTVRNALLPGHVVTNLTVSTRMGQTDVSLGIYNVFNKRHADPASFETREDAIRQNGRTYRVKLAYAF